MNLKVRHYLIRLDPEFKNIFKQKKDPFSYLASIIFQVPYSECNPYDKVNEKGYKICEHHSYIGEVRRKAAKMTVVAAVYPKYANIDVIISLFKEVQEYGN